MSKTIKRLTICGMALVMSGVINVGSSAVKNNNIEAQASRIHRGLRRQNHRANHVNNRIKGLYKALHKMGMNNEHAVALLDLIAFQDPSMNNNTTNRAKHLYGFYQQSQLVVKYEARSEHKPMTSLTVQTNALFSSKGNIKKYEHHKGSITNLTHYLFHTYFDPITSQKKHINYNQPLGKIIRVTRQNWIKVPKPAKPNAQKRMIIREVQDNKQQSRQHQKGHKTVDTVNLGSTKATHHVNWHYRDGTGGISESVPSDGEISWRAGQVPSDVIPYIHNPKDVGMDLGTGTGWSDPGGECVNFANSYFTAIWGINNTPYVMGNGIDMADNWNQELSGGRETNTPHAGAIASTSQTALTGGNPAGHTFIVEHVFKDGDILVAEENWPSESGDDNGTPNTWNYAVFSQSLMSQNTKFYMPNTHKFHLNWNNN